MGHLADDSHLMAASLVGRCRCRCETPSLLRRSGSPTRVVPDKTRLHVKSDRRRRMPWPGFGHDKRDPISISRILEDSYYTGRSFKKDQRIGCFD